MSEAAYDRARKLMASRAGAVFQSVLVLGLFGVAGLLGVLVTSRGAAEVHAGDIGVLPGWIQSHIAGEKRDSVILDDSGLFPIVAGNLENPNPAHRFGGMVALGLLQSIPALRTNEGALQTLLALAFTFVLLLTLVTRLRRSALAEVSCEVAAALRRQIHRQMYRLGQSSLPTEGTGPVVNLFTREVNDVRDGIFAQLDVSSRVTVLVLGLASFLLLVSWVSTLFIAALGTLVWLTVRALRRSSEALTVIAVRDAALQLSALQEDLSLLRIVRVHGMENVDKTRFDEHLDRYTDADIRRIVTLGHGRSILFLMYGAATVAALGLLAYTVVAKGHSAVSALFLIATLGGLVVPFFEWLRMRRAIAQASRSATAIFDYLDRSPELHQAGGAQFLSPLKTRITFENVTLENSSGRKLLDGLNVEIKAGSRVAVMGLDEDSKYALVCLIPRLIDPKVGRIRVDGHDLRDVTLESIRAQVSTVLQSDLVFSDTVLANIALGDPSYDLPRVMEAAKLAHAHAFIQDLPDGYETLIGPLGHYLSPDQQYRIGLARAALHDPSIVIVEEPATELDDEVKAYLDDTISRLGRGRTVIILPHRLSTIRSCDQVIVLQNGRVDASGPPREIHTESKLYRHIQYMEFNQFATGEVEAGQMNG
jgi:ATP-binding cassette subfamily B protein